MAKVSDYSILFYGGKTGYQTNRAQIRLNGEDGKAVALVRFQDPGMEFEADSEENGVIRMHLPSMLMHSVLHTLQHQKDLEVHLRSGSGFLGTSS